LPFNFLSSELSNQEGSIAKGLPIGPNCFSVYSYVPPPDTTFSTSIRAVPSLSSIQPIFQGEIRHLIPFHSMHAD
jgi:hypothetical protein